MTERFAASPCSVVVPAAHGASVVVRAGQHVAVVDLEGMQVGDLFAFNAHDTTEFASAPHTRAALAKLFPRPGDAISSNKRRPMLTLEEDTSPGLHDTLYAACDPARYEQLGSDRSHRSCATNLVEAMARHGGLLVPVPQPFNVFMDVRARGDGGLEVFSASTRPGDRLVFRAEMDTVVVLSSCPMDLYPLSGAAVTALGLEVLDATSKDLAETAKTVSPPRGSAGEASDRR